MFTSKLHNRNNFAWTVCMSKNDILRSTSRLHGFYIVRRNGQHPNPTRKTKPLLTPPAGALFSYNPTRRTHQLAVYIPFFPPFRNGTCVIRIRCQSNIHPRRTPNSGRRKPAYIISINFYTYKSIRRPCSISSSRYIDSADAVSSSAAIIHRSLHGGYLIVLTAR